MRTTRIGFCIAWGLAMGCCTHAWASEPLLLEGDAKHHAPQVVSGVDRRLLLGPGDEIEVRGPHTERLVLGAHYRLVRWPAPSPRNDTALGPQWVTVLGQARTVRTHPTATVAWLRIEAASDAVQIGDWVWWWPSEVHP
jgi:hypothetical protein